MQVVCDFYKKKFTYTCERKAIEIDERENFKDNLIHTLSSGI